MFNKYFVYILASKRNGMLYSCPRVNGDGTANGFPLKACGNDKPYIFMSTYLLPLL